MRQDSEKHHTRSSLHESKEESRLFFEEMGSPHASPKDSPTSRSRKNMEKSNKRLSQRRRRVSGAKEKQETGKKKEEKIPGRVDQESSEGIFKPPAMIREQIVKEDGGHGKPKEEKGKEKEKVREKEKSVEGEEGVKRAASRKANQSEIVHGGEGEGGIQRRKREPSNDKERRILEEREEGRDFKEEVPGTEGELTTSLPVTLPSPPCPSPDSTLKGEAKGIEVFEGPREGGEERKEAAEEGLKVENEEKGGEEKKVFEGGEEEDAGPPNRPVPSLPVEREEGEDHVKEGEANGGEGGIKGVGQGQGKGEGGGSHPVTLNLHLVQSRITGGTSEEIPTPAFPVPKILYGEESPTISNRTNGANGTNTVDDPIVPSIATNGPSGASDPHRANEGTSVDNTVPETNVTIATTTTTTTTTNGSNGTTRTTGKTGTTGTTVTASAGLRPQRRAVTRRPTLKQLAERRAAAEAKNKPGPRAKVERKVEEEEEKEEEAEKGEEKEGGEGKATEQVRNFFIFFKFKFLTKENFRTVSKILNFGFLTTY
jgi:hypothetical protein